MNAKQALAISQQKVTPLSKDGINYRIERAAQMGFQEIQVKGTFDKEWYESLGYRVIEHGASTTIRWGKTEDDAKQMFKDRGYIQFDHNRFVHKGLRRRIEFIDKRVIITEGNQVVRLEWGIIDMIHAKLKEMKLG